MKFCTSALNTLQAVMIIVKQIKEINFYEDNSQAKVCLLVANRSMNCKILNTMVHS